MVEKISNKTFLPAQQVKKVIIAGLGGTGSYFAAGLVKMVAGHRLETEIVLVDHDRVEEKNIARQNFDPCDVGMFKVEAVADELNRRYGMNLYKPVATYAGKIEDYISNTSNYISQTTLIVSCLDRVAPRCCLKDFPMWLDMGNELDFGQAIFGTTRVKKNVLSEQSSWGKSPFVRNIPNPFLKLGMDKIKDAPKITSCADMPFSEQGVFVNQWSSEAGLNIASQILIEREVRFPAIYFSTKEARMMPCAITKDYIRT